MLTLGYNTGRDLMLRKYDVATTEDIIYKLLTLYCEICNIRQFKLS